MTEAIEQRMTELEIKLTFVDDTVRALADADAGQSLRIATLERTLRDIRDANVDVVTMGQYMRPSVNHLPVERFVSPDEFKRYRDIALGMGFLEAVAGPLVRSSYRAERVLEHNNLGL